MLIVLPPSETKSHGGSGAPLDLDALSFPPLNRVRAEILADLIALDRDTAREVLKLGTSFDTEFESNRALLTSPTAPALSRYTGVLFDALSPATIPTERWSRIAVGSALFGLIGAHDPIPHYRLSAGTKLPPRAATETTRPTMRKRWGSEIASVLDDMDELVLDFRSGAYRALGFVDRSITVRVETTAGKVVSHFNKRYKGELTRELCLHEAEPESIAEVVEIAREAGLDLSQRTDTELVLVVPA